MAAQIGNRLGGLARLAVDRGVPPEWLGFRGIAHCDLDDISTPPPPGVRRHIVQPCDVASNPLPLNVDGVDELPDDRGWWGYSMRDVPHRRSGPTYLATVDDATVTWYRNRHGDFVPAVLSGNRRSLDMREMRWRRPHAAVRRSQPVHHLRSAVWILERAFHNHSHWLTAHVPKLVILRDQGLLEEILLPEEPTAMMASSLRRLGVDPDELRRFDEDHVLRIDQLTLVGNDRFRPELLRTVRDALAVPTERPHRRLYISRSRATRRRLVNEPEIVGILRDAGFESVVLEDMSVEEQAELMGQASVICGPHGAGLTNMVLCAPGTHVIEFADLDFPNPNFYAMSAALGHPYWLLPAEVAGPGSPLERDMSVDPSRLERTIRLVDGASSRR